MDYAYPERRKNRNDRRAKSRYLKYKTGGSQRSMNVSGKDSEKNS